MQPVGPPALRERMATPYQEGSHEEDGRQRHLRAARRSIRFFSHATLHAWQRPDPREIRGEVYGLSRPVYLPAEFVVGEESPDDRDVPNASPVSRLLERGCGALS